LWREECSAGISTRAYILWVIASVLILLNAIALQSIVFIALGAIQIISTVIILVLSIRYSGKTCPAHTPASAAPAP
jgi:hypothetical protein